MTQDFNNADGFVDQVKEYVNIRLAQLKLLFAEKTSKVMSVMLAVVISALVFFLFLVLISIAGAIAIGQWLESPWLGFVIVGGVVLVVGLVLWVSKERLIGKLIMNALLRVIFDKEENEKD